MHLDCIALFHTACLHCIVLLHIALAGEPTRTVEISCSGDCVQNKKTDIKFPSALADTFIYKPTPEINGTFLRNLGVESGGGECIDSLKYSLKGRNDKVFTSPVVWPQDQMIPDFGEINLCQQVSLYGYVEYKECPRDSGDQAKVRLRKIPRYPTFSPLQTWLEGKVDDKLFPDIHLSPGNIPVVSWGPASKFGCDSSSVHTMADINFKIIQEETGKILTEDHTFRGPDIFKTITLANLKIEELGKKSEWNLVIEFKLTFFRKNKGSSKQTQKPVIFKRKLKARDKDKIQRTARTGFKNSSNSLKSGSLFVLSTCILSFSRMLTLAELK